MKLNTPIHYFPILCINILFTISYSQMERASLFDMEEIHALRADISRDLIIEQPDGSQRNMSRCDFVVLNPDAAHIDPETIDQWNNLHRSSILTIPVAFHIIHKTDNDNTGYIEQSKLEAQISSLNAAYASLDIQFQLSSVDYTANDDWFGIACGSFNESECGTHPNHCNWYSDSEPQCQENNTFEDTYKSTLVVNHATTLNIYSGELGGTLGYAYLPTDLASIPSYMDGVVLHYPTLEEIGDSNSPYNEGDTGIHEVGHYLGLHHTFHGGCDAGQCNGLSTTCLEIEGCIINVSDICVYGGDEVADTPEQDYGDNIYECLEADTCPSDPGNDPIHNYMNYVEDHCMNEFTSDQKIRMDFMMENYREDLGEPMDDYGDGDCPDGVVMDCAGVCDGGAEVDECGVCGGDATSVDECDDDCHQYTSETDCNMYNHCWWDAEDGGYCDDCAYDGAPKCIRDCTGVCGVDPVTDPVGYCDWFGDLMDNNQTENGLTGCLADCGEDSDFEIPHLNMTEWVCSECNAIEDDNCQWISHTVSDPDKRCGGYNTSGECTSNTFCAWDNTDEGYCDEADCEYGGYEEGECNGYSQCAWDVDDESGTCHFYDPHECLHGCTGDEAPPASPTPNQHCAKLIGVWDENGCTSECDFLVNVEYSICNECDAWFYFDGGGDDCNQYTSADECPLDHCWWDAEAGDSGECIHDEGPPDCLSECEGIGDVDLEVDPMAFCEWIILTIGDSNCAQDCDADATAEITDMFNLCTTGLAGGEGACDEAYLSTDEKNLLLPEEFTLHPVYPNPFNPTTDIGFSLELAGPVSISVYDVTGRRVETILHYEFRNGGSHIINWNGSQFPSGIYFIHLQAGKQIAKQKVTLLK